MKISNKFWIGGLFLGLLGMVVVTGCGGSSSTSEAQTTTAEVSSSQGTATSGVSAIKTALLSSMLRSGGDNSTLLGTDALSSANLGSCTESTDSGSGSGFSVICDCIVDGSASGTITTVFDSSLAEQSCEQSGGAGGTALSISGSVTVTFEQCAIDGCGENLILDGIIQGTISYSHNGCTSSEVLDASASTESGCSGLVITHADTSTDTVGFSATWSGGSSGTTQSGNACVNNETTDLSGLEDVCDAQSPSSCSAATVSCVSDFACQMFADNNSNNAFNTDNVTCVSGCCVVSETGRCSDSEDNDFDGQIDCSDSDCLTDPYCVVGPCGSSTVSCSNDFTCQVFAETSSTDQFTTSNVSCSNACCVVVAVYETGQCTDGSDNDSDGSADCNDSDCAGDLACGARLPCTNEWQCRALVAGTTLASATPTCIRYDVGHSYYQYNDGSCQYDCATAADPAGCITNCIPLARTMPQGGYANHVEQLCRFYPPPH